jgi:diguanylate cyclase (GGDEF)-like protein
VQLFSSLTRDEIDLLSARAVERFFEPGSVIIRQGELSDHLFVLLSGHAQIVEVPEEPWQTEMMLGEVSIGDVIGEMAALTEMPRSATVMAVDLVHAVAIAGNEFRRLVNSSPSLAGSLAHMLARRVWDTDQKLTRFAPDPLTGVLSRQSFQDQYPRIAAQARRHGTGLLLVLLDVVNLRGVNDSAGYSVGDEVLRTVAQALLQSARMTDLVCRWSGDEFILVPVDADLTAVDPIINRLQVLLADLCRARDLPEGVRCAYGTAFARDPSQNPLDLVRQADEDILRRKAAERAGQ